MSAESVKQRVIRLLSLQGGRMATKVSRSTSSLTNNLYCCIEWILSKRGTFPVVNSQSRRRVNLCHRSLLAWLLLTLSLPLFLRQQFISTFNITSNKSDLFKFVRKSINEVCEVHTDTINGEQVKVLELLVSHNTQIEVY